jgi:ferredoxin
VTYIIAEPCIDLKDRSCVDVCPVDCIHEASRILVIDPEECIACGACEPECPVEAILPEDALPEQWRLFIRINYAYGEGISVSTVSLTSTATTTTAPGSASLVGPRRDHPRRATTRRTMTLTNSAAPVFRNDSPMTVKSSREPRSA